MASNGRPLPLLVAIAGLAASTISAWLVAGFLQQRAADEFAFAADQVTTQVREHLESSHLVLRGGVTLLEESGPVSRENWRHYVERLDLTRTLPGVNSVGFVAWLTGEQLATHEAAVRAEGFPDYRVWPAGQRDWYAPVLYVEPFRGQNLRAFGRDMHAEPVRREAMERARDTGLPALSGKLELVGEPSIGSQPGAMMFMAVYHHGMPRNTVAERRAALSGWVVSTYRMHDLLSETLKSWASREGRFIDLHLYDGDTASPAALLFDSVVTETPSTESPFIQRRVIDFYGHRWLLEFDRITGSPGVDYTPAWILLGSGFTITGLLAVLLLTLARTEQLAQQRAGELTASLREREHELLEAQRIGKTGSWKLDAASGRIIWSEAIERIFGGPDDEISGLALTDYQQHFTADSWADVVTAFTRILHDGQPYEQELEVVGKSGVHAWLLVHGEAIRNEDGAIVGLQGSAADITERKRMELALLQQQAELEEAQRIGHTGNWHIDLATMQSTWSTEIYRMTGLDPALPAPNPEAQRDIFTPDSYRRLTDAVTQALGDHKPYYLELEYLKPDGSHGWMEIRGETVADHQNQIVALRGSVADITKHKQLQLRTEYLSKLYATLSECNLMLIRCDNDLSLFTGICEILAKTGGMAMAWVGLTDDVTGRIVPVAAYGEGLAYLDAIEISCRADDPHGQGPTGTAVRENRPFWVQDFQASMATTPWHGRAQQYQWQASAALPLCRNGKPVGALTFYSRKEDFFDEEIRQLLQEIAESISFGLDKIAADAEARMHQATLRESEQRFRILVEQSIAGTFILQDSKIVYANPRAVEIFGYKDYGELAGKPVLDVIDTRDHDRIASNMLRLLDNEIHRSDDLFTGLRADHTTVEVGSSSTLVTYNNAPAIIGIIQDISDRKVAENQIRRYAQRLEHTFFQTVQLATTISEMRDAYTAGHERRVAEIAVAIGGEMGLDQNRLEGLRIGGYLHDVGKIIVPAEILTKPTRLTATEYALIQQHAQAGYDILKEVDFPWPVAQIAQQHHERIDGTGYPQGLKGDSIILEARIVAVADVIESMASHRPYRPGLGIDKGLAEIERGSGTAYDPAVVEACLLLFRDKGFQLPPH